jgi:tetratricopeptide (TPR) repeat protein
VRRPQPRRSSGALSATIGISLLAAAADAGRLAFADAAFRAGGTTGGSSASALACRAGRCAAGGFPLEAEALARAAAAAAPRRSSLRVLHGSLLAGLGREAEAREEWESAFALDPMRAPVARLAAAAALARYRESGDSREIERAVARLRIANLAEPSGVKEGIFLLHAHGADPLLLRSCVPDHPEARLCAGQAFLDLGMPGAAAAELSQAVGCGKPEKREELLERAALLLEHSRRAP